MINSKPGGLTGQWSKVAMYTSNHKISKAQRSKLAMSVRSHKTSKVEDSYVQQKP